MLISGIKLEKPNTFLVCILYMITYKSKNAKENSCFLKKILYKNFYFNFSIKKIFYLNTYK